VCCRSKPAAGGGGRDGGLAVTSCVNRQTTERVTLCSGGPHPAVTSSVKLVRLRLVAVGDSQNRTLVGLAPAVAPAAPAAAAAAGGDWRAAGRVWLPADQLRRVLNHTST